MGFVQMLTAVYLLGWGASIYWGYLIIKKSSGDHNEIKQLISAGNGNSAAGNGNGNRNANNG